MSRTRTIRRTPVSKRKQHASWNIFRFLPFGFQAFLARRIVDIVAGALFLTGLFIVLSLFGYHHADPSWNTAVIAEEGLRPPSVHNWMGASGAWLSDILLQTLGIGSFVFGLVLLVWGVRVFSRQGIGPVWLRLIATVLSAVSCSVMFAQVPSQGWMPHPYLGSSTGTLLFTTALQGFSGLKAWVGPVMIAATASLFTALSGIYASATKWDEIGYIIYNVVVFVQRLGLYGAYVGRSFQQWLEHHNDPDYRPNLLSFLHGFSAVGEEDGDEECDEAPARRRSRRAVMEEDLDSFDEEETPIARRMLKATKPSGVIPVVTPALGKGKAGAKNAVAKGAVQQQRFSLSEDHDDWEFPSLALLSPAPAEPQGNQLNEAALQKNAELLQNVLADFNVEGDVVSIHPGPVVTLYELEPAPGTKSAKVIGLSDDIARSMSAVSVRVAVVPGRNVIGIELPNKTRQYVYMQDLLASQLYEKTSAKLPLVLGKDIGGQPILADLAKMPHLLVAGTTGSGKSVAVNTMILSLLYHLSPAKCRFIMIDPKMLELSVYDGIPHLLAPVVTEPGKAIVSLKWTVNEMEERYRAMSKLGVRNIEGYNERVREAARKGEVIMQKLQTGFELDTGKPVYEDQPLDLTELPYIVVVVDEFADLMLVAGKDVESAIQRLAQMARAAGIHLIMATQRPSVDVITGVIKANFPTRISFQVTSKIDSRTILGEGGAEQLLGMGDMLYMAPGGRITRVHGPFVSDGDVEKVVNDLKSKAEPAYIDSITEEGAFGEGGSGGFGESGGEKVDDLYDQAVALVAREGKASTSFVQRYLQIGYNRAARIIEEMERQGVISKANAVGKREVLIHDFSEM